MLTSGETFDFDFGSVRAQAWIQIVHRARAHGVEAFYGGLF